jgi:multisubunit Na+/H+ antiporter MnhB subunit
MRRILLWGFTGLVLAALGIMLLSAGVDLLGGSRWGTEVVPGPGLSERTKDHLLFRAVVESGAINLVSAIYLGYRAFDTLGETIVLVLSVAGVLLVSGARQ